MTTYNRKDQSYEPQKEIRTDRTDNCSEGLVPTTYPCPQSSSGLVQVPAVTLRLAEGTNIITGLPSPPDPSTTSEIGESPDLPTATFLGHSSSPSSDRISQDGVATPRPDTTSMESHKQQGLATSYVAPLEDIGGISSTVPASVVGEADASAS